MTFKTNQEEKRNIKMQNIKLQTMQTKSGTKNGKSGFTFGLHHFLDGWGAGKNGIGRFRPGLERSSMDFGMKSMSLL